MQHLARKAFVYVRQSTVRQVFENSESTKRQYDLQQTAVALGWTTEQIVVIDSDLGKSGASRDRDGFRTLVAEVGLNNVGVVLSLEVSRFARNSGDWHQLLEICALTDTLIVDEAGIYDPSQFNDRLLLGLKGTMSEAELHVMRARLRGGLLNKARRGELECPVPAGFVYDHQGRVVLDPDKQVQNSVRLLFDTFSRTGTAYATAMHFRKHSLRFPSRVHGGARHGELQWRLLTHQRVVDALRNPRYAGAFAYGRTQSRKRVDGPKSKHRRPREQWLALVLDAHPAYIPWSEHEANIARLRETAQAFGSERCHGPAREGPALLQGVLLRGVCGAHMNVRYRRRRDGLVPYYSCRVSDEQQLVRSCSVICGATLDAAVSELLVASLTPEASKGTRAKWCLHPPSFDTGNHPWDGVGRACWNRAPLLGACIVLASQAMLLNMSKTKCLAMLAVFSGGWGAAAGCDRPTHVAHNSTEAGTGDSGEAAAPSSPAGATSRSVHCAASDCRNYTGSVVEVRKRAASGSHCYRAEIGTCGELKYVLFSSGFDHFEEYFDATGKMVFGEDQTDMDPKPRTFGEKPSCAKVTAERLCPRSSPR